MTEPRAETLADVWLARDCDQARDRDEAHALRASRGIRHWILQRWLESPNPSSDVLSGFAQLGRTLAGDSVSCASALRSVSSFATLWSDDAHTPRDDALEAARSALGDAFVEARLDDQRRSQRARFDHGWTEITSGVAAVVADPPTDDPEWLQEWADAMTRALLRQKIRVVHLGVSGVAREVLLGAFGLVDIQLARPDATPPAKSWANAWANTCRRLGW